MVLAALLLSVSVNAQKAVGSWSLQPKAGINIATMTNDDDAKTRIGLVAGAEVDYQATPSSPSPQAPSIPNRALRQRLTV